VENGAARYYTVLNLTISNANRNITDVSYETFSQREGQLIYLAARLMPATLLHELKHREIPYTARAFIALENRVCSQPSTPLLQQNL
jgi:hypothetical protein